MPLTWDRLENQKSLEPGGEMCALTGMRILPGMGRRLMLALAAGLEGGETQKGGLYGREPG